VASAVARAYIAGVWGLCSSGVQFAIYCHLGGGGPWPLWPPKSAYGPVRRQVREIQHVRFLGHKVEPDAGPDISFRVNTRCPVRFCVRLIAVNQTIDSMLPPDIKILLIYTRTDVSCKRNCAVDEEDEALLLKKC
jgi:hypothetical protein